jgi:branched-chain amino acid aminotransferase
LNAQNREHASADTIRWPNGAGYMNGAYMPVTEVRIPVTDWGYRRSDATYDVVSVWGGAFFRLDDHIKRFRRSMDSLRLKPKESDEEIKAILHRMVGLSGLRTAYVGVDCLRGRSGPGERIHPVNARNYIVAFASPYHSLMSDEVVARGAHMIVASTPRIPQRSVDATAKNFHWADMTRASFEAEDKGADNPVLLDYDGYVTEGPGFNVFTVTDGVVATPDFNMLEGISRLSAIDLCEELGLRCEIRKISADELREADEIFVTSTAGGIIGVSRIDGRIMNNDRPGPISQKIRETYWSKREEGWHADPVNYDVTMD